MRPAKDGSKDEGDGFCYCWPSSFYSIFIIAVKDDKYCLLLDPSIYLFQVQYRLIILTTLSAGGFHFIYINRKINKHTEK